MVVSYQAVGNDWADSCIGLLDPLVWFAACSWVFSRHHVIQDRRGEILWIPLDAELQRVKITRICQVSCSS